MTKDEIVNPWDSAKQVAVKILAKAADMAIDDVLDSIEVPPESAMGDLASTLAFALAKTLRKNPAVIATEIVERLNPLIAEQPMIGNAEAKGPYINIFFDRTTFTQRTIELIDKAGPHYGNTSQYKGKRILIESPAVKRAGFGAPGRPSDRCRSPRAGRSSRPAARHRPRIHPGGWLPDRR